MIETRWKLTGCAAALLLGLIAVQPAMATETVCSVDWDDDGTFSSADLDGDGKVDGVDLGMLLGQWGACPRCASDFNVDGQVGCLDKEYLMGNWGPCPQLEVDCTDVSLLKNSLGPCTHGPEYWPEEDYDPTPESCSEEDSTFEFPSFDVDNDGIVDGDDLNLVNCLLGSDWPPGSLPPVDFNTNGVVDQEDLNLVEGALGNICNDLDQDGMIGWPDVYVLIKRWP